MGGDVPQQVTKQKRGNTIWLRDPTYETVKARATRAGVSMSAFIENALLELRTPFPPTATVAAPLAKVGYYLTQIIAALERGDLDTARRKTEQTRDIITEALLPLRREHASEARELRRIGEDWSG
jgi:hypothetical protein